MKPWMETLISACIAALVIAAFVGLIVLIAAVPNGLVYFSLGVLVICFICLIAFIFWGLTTIFREMIFHW